MNYLKNRIVLIFLFSILFSRTLEVTFNSDVEWLFGQTWIEGTAFYNSTNIGSPLLYGESTLSENDVKPVDIAFYATNGFVVQSLNPDSITYATVYNANNFSEVLGIGIFPGTVWSNVGGPQGNDRVRVNICFYELPGGDLIWNPISASGSNKEYLIIMQSEYDGDGTTYQNLNAINEDVQYFSWLKRKAGEEWFASEPAELNFRLNWEFEYFSSYSDDQQIQLKWMHENEMEELNQIAYYEIYRNILNYPEMLVAEVPLGINEYLDTNLINGTIYDYQIIGFNEGGDIVIQSEIISNIPNPISFNTSLVGHWNLGHDYNGSGPKYNDIWGYTDYNGIEYALIGTWDGTHIIDITTNPLVPNEIAFIPGSFSSHRDIKTSGNYMYVGTEANFNNPESDEYEIIPQGIQVIDLENSQLVNEWDGVVQSHNIMEHEGYLYVIGSTSSIGFDNSESWGLDDLIILDLSNPSNPIKVGGWSGEYLHDVCMYDDILYGCGIYTDEMHAFDISDKSNPILIQSWGGIPKAHACWVSEDGNTVFTGSETTGGHIMSFDVTDVSNINLLDEWLPLGGEDWSAHNTFIKGDYLYVSYYTYGLQILDISNPSDMQIAGFYDTYNQYVPGAIFNGAWGTFPYFESNKILISDRSTGLYVVNFESSIECSSNGDINNDNQTNILDIIQIMSYILENSDFSNTQQCIADINLDNSINILDVILIVNTLTDNL